MHQLSNHVNRFFIILALCVAFLTEPRQKMGQVWMMFNKLIINALVLSTQVHPHSLIVTDKTSWKRIKITTSIPISCHRGRGGCRLKVDIHRHSAIVTDKCHLSITERNRKKYALYVKAIKDFRKLGRQKVWISFKRIKPIAGLSRFWVGYKPKSVRVSESSHCCSILAKTNMKRQF